MSRELSRVTWPLPWWIVAVPAAVLALLGAYWISTATSWAYVAPARLSGMLSASVSVVGLLACVVAAWVAERFANRRSPLTWSVKPRADGRLALTVSRSVVIWWAIAVGLAAAIATASVLKRASGGRFYPIELAIGLCGMSFFALSGLLIGMSVARWHAPLWGALWAASWLWIIPLYAGGLFPSPSNNVEYFLFPGVAASDHGPLNSWVVAIVLGWWLLVLLVLTAAVWGWQRFCAGLLSRGAAAGIVLGLPAVASGGVLLAHILPSPFHEPGRTPAICEAVSAASAVEVCVSPEQRRLLPQIAREAAPGVARMGDAWPSDIRRVSSYDIAGRGSHPDADSIGINVSSYGASTIPMDIGVGLTGLDHSTPNVSDQRAIGWAFTFGDWFSESPDFHPEVNSQAASLAEATIDEVRAWYRQNEAALRSCTYVGSGPG